MCGIAGCVGPRLDDAEALALDMASALRHRGPDDSGSWAAQFEDRTEDYSVALAHRRLSVLDPSPAGRQPMTSRDGLATVVLNGEIYNFRSLRRELERCGSSFRTRTDSEVLVEGFRQQGLSILDRLEGMFAFALWDGEHRKLYLVRDRLGIKPLYLAEIGDQLLWASELGAFRMHPGFQPEIDRLSLAHFLAYGYVAAPSTIYEKVRRVRSGELIDWTRGRITSRKYWNPSRARSDRGAGNGFRETVDRLEALLHDSVSARLISDVPLGAFLSGGLDSTAVVATMARATSAKVRTFTIGFEDRAFDESLHARNIASHLGTEHRELVVTQADALEVARELPRLYDEPFADASAIPTVLVSRLAREEVTVALSGDGGDELFGGYSRYRRIDQFQRLGRLPRLVRRLAGTAARAFVSAPRRYRLDLLAAADVAEFAERITARFPYSHVEAACGRSPLSTREVYRKVFRESGAPQAARRAMAADVETYLVDDILTKLDRASMSVGLEGRVPLLDPAIVDFALSLPLELTWHGDRSKAPLRALVARHVPEDLFERPKSGFGIPLAGLLGRELDHWKRRYLDPSRLEEEGLLSTAAVAQMQRATDSSQRMAVRGLWHLLCFERWFAVHHRGEPGT